MNEIVQKEIIHCLNDCLVFIRDSSMTQKVQQSGIDGDGHSKISGALLSVASARSETQTLVDFLDGHVRLMDWVCAPDGLRIHIIILFAYSYYCTSGTLKWLSELSR